MKVIWLDFECLRGIWLSSYFENRSKVDIHGRTHGNLSLSLLVVTVLLNSWGSTHVEHLVAVSLRRSIITVKRKIRLDEGGCFLVLLCYGPLAECHTKPLPRQQIISPADIGSTCHGLGITFWSCLEYVK